MRWWARLAAAVAVAVTFCVSGTPPAIAAPRIRLLHREIRSRRAAKPCCTRCCRTRAISTSLSNMRRSPRRSATTRRPSQRSSACSSSRPIPRACSLSSASSITVSAATRCRAAISRKWSPIQMSRPKLPQRCGSICNSSPSRLSLPPLARRSSAAFAGRAIRRRAQRARSPP